MVVCWVVMKLFKIIWLAQHNLLFTITTNVSAQMCFDYQQRLTCQDVPTCTLPTFYMYMYLHVCVSWLAMPSPDQEVGMEWNCVLLVHNSMQLLHVHVG